MSTTLYDNAMQVVPLLLISLFVESRDVEARQANWLNRLQDKMFAVLGIVAFFTSTFVVSDVLGDLSLTRAVVIASLGGSIGLLFGQIWRRFARRKTPAAESVVTRDHEQRPKQT